MNHNLQLTFPSNYTIDTYGETIVLQNATQPLYNKTLGTTAESGALYMNTQNTSAVGTQSNYISMYDNPIFFRGQNTTQDAKHYITYAGVGGNSFGGYGVDGVVIAGSQGGLLGCSATNVAALRWDGSSNVTCNNALNVTGVINANGSSNQSYTYAYLNSSATVGTATSTGSYSILASGRIKCAEIDVVSSIKLKTIEAPLTDPATMTEAVALFKSIPLSKYKYTDSQRYDTFEHFGLIAENMPNGLYVDSTTNSGYVPNIFSGATIDSVDTQYRLHLTLATPITVEKLLTIETLTNVLCYTSTDGINYTTLKIFQNLIVVDSTHVSIYDPNDNYESDVETTVFVYGTAERIPTVMKNSYFELTSCVVQNLLARVEDLEARLKRTGFQYIF